MARVSGSAGREEAGGEQRPNTAAAAAMAGARSACCLCSFLPKHEHWGPCWLAQHSPSALAPFVPSRGFSFGRLAVQHLAIAGACVYLVEGGALWGAGSWVGSGRWGHACEGGLVGWGARWCCPAVGCVLLCPAGNGTSVAANNHLPWLSSTRSCLLTVGCVVQSAMQLCSAALLFTGSTTL